MCPVILLVIQGLRYTLAVDPAARPVTPVPFLCLQISWVPLSTPPPVQGTHLPSLCTILVVLKALVALVVVANAHPHQQGAVQACPFI